MAGLEKNKTTWDKGYEDGLTNNYQNMNYHDAGWRLARTQEESDEWCRGWSADNLHFWCNKKAVIPSYISPTSKLFPIYYLSVINNLVQDNLAGIVYTIFDEE